MSECHNLVAEPENKTCKGVGCQNCCGKNWPRIYLRVLVGVLGVLGILGGVYVGVRIGRRQVTPSTIIISQPTGTMPTVVEPSPILTQDPTAGWKTYTSTALGFTFKYPAEYNLPKESEHYLSLDSPLNPDRSIKDYTFHNGELKIEIVTEAAEENDSSVKCWNDHDSGETKIINQSETMINGIVTTIFDWEGHGTGQLICVTYNKQRYLINKYPLETTRQTEFDQILSTFKFTE